LRPHQQNSFLQGKIAGIFKTTSEASQQGIYEALLGTRPGQQSQIGILRESRASPTLYRQSTDDTRLPALLLAKGLRLRGGGEYSRKLFQIAFRP
jgi:hypothetical protein